MNRQPRKPYDPIVILLIPRWSSAAHTVQSLRHVIDGIDYAVAIATDDEQSSQFRTSWTIVNEMPLVVLRIEPEASFKWAVEAVSQIAKANKDKAVSVLLVDGADADGFAELKRAKWNRQFAELLQRVILDSQVHEYSRSWATSPPRSR